MDLVDRDDVSENAILEELRVRFLRNEIYSSIGPIIIALNPYRNIADLYSAKNMSLYMESEHTPLGYHKHPPHVWTIAQSAFTHLKKTKACQAIVISGESGAGKTEATKKCLQYLSAIAQLSSSSSSQGSKTDEVPVEDRVLETNPILESFGNSKTSRNNNSSRFGKWIDISFRSDPASDKIQLVGAHITQYLLEKSRVVVQSTEERNYHIFYQLCSDPKWGLKDPSEYRYLNQSGSLTVEGVDDREEFRATLKSFDNLGFSETMKNTILTALKAILLLGNVDILANKAASAGEGTTSSRLIIIPPSCEKLLEEVASMLGLPAEVFKVSVTIRSMTVRGETTRIPLDYAASMDCKNALAKEIYGRLFSQIVQQANVSLQPPTTSGPSNRDQGAPDELMSIGLLDIFGFEKFKLNSFEQLCINYANEKLQQYFLNYVLKKEQELYDSEGIDYTKVIPIDNEDVLYLIEDRKKGIFVKLDDELKLPKSTDETFLKKIEQEHNSKLADRRFLKDIKMGKTQFEIRHFAGVIRYDVKGFLDKNKDRLFDHLEELLCESTNLPFRKIMVDHGPAALLAAAAAAAQESGNSSSSSSGKESSSGVTISSRFTSQLNKLMQVLDASQPHFIKCIKPNNYKRAADYDLEMILLQLRYSGVLEAIMIRKSGYPTRRRHADFRKAYWMLARLSKMKLNSVGEDEERKCRMIVEALAAKNNEQYGDIKVGKTLVFLKPNVLQVLEREKQARGALAVLFLQSAARRRHDAKRCVILVKGRRQLRLCVKEGKLKNSGNVEAIPALRDAIDHCRCVIDLYCYEVTEAEKLLARLYEVQECLNQIKKFLSQQNNSSSASYNDVISEYTALTKILDTAVKLHLDESQLVDIRARVEVLKERASAVLHLRTAIDDGDEEALQKALNVIEGLKKVHGAFCDSDEKFGREIQSKIKLENEIIMSSIQTLNDFHSSYQKKAEKEETQSWLSEGLTVSSNAVKQVMAPFMTAPAVCSVSTASFKVLRTLLHLHDYWGRKQWPSLGDTVVQLVNEKKVIAEKQKTLSSPSPALTAMQALIDSYLSVVEVDTNRFYLQPLLCESLQRGKASGEVGQINYNSIDFDSLAATVEEVKQFCWNADKLKPLFHRLEVLVELRSACVEERVETILRLGASTQQAEDAAMRAREFDRQMSAIKKSLSFVEAEDTEEGQVSGAGGENISDFVKALAARQQSYTAAGSFAGMGEEFGSAMQMIDSECAFILADAVDKDIRRRVGPVLPVGSALHIDHMHDESRATLSSVVNSAPLSLLLSEVDHIEQQSAALGVKSVTSEVTIVLLKSVEMLLELRNLLISGDYGIVVELCESNKLIVLSAIAVETELSRQLLSLSSFLLIKDEAIRIISISFNAVSIQLLLLSLRHGTIRGGVGRKDKSLVDFAMLEENMTYCQQHTQRLIEYGETMTEEFDTLKTMSVLVVEIRRSFLEPVRDVPKLKNLLDELQSYTNVYVFPTELEKEIVDVSRELEYGSCVQAIQKVFDVPASDVPYLIPFIKSRKRTISTSKNRSVGFDVSTSASADGSVTVVHNTQDDIEDILLEEEKMLNDVAVETEEINVALYEVNQIKDIIPAEEFPPEFEHMVLSLELIKRMRESVKRGDWIQSQKTLSEIVSQNLPTLAPMIEREVSLCGEMVNNYAVIAACKSALLKNQPTGIIGQMDYKSISIEHMEEVILLCQSIGFKSSRAEALFKAVLIVTDLRRAQKVGDWGAIKAALQRAASENVGRGMTSLCLGEINRSVIEAENYDAIQQLKKAIILEEIFTKDCLLDLDHASIQILSESYQKAVQVNEDSRGAILKALISLTEVMLKSRKAAIQKNWTLLEDCISIVKDHLETFHNEIEKVDTNPKNKPHSFRASAITMTKSPPPRRGSLLASKDSPKTGPDSTAEGASAFNSPVPPHKNSAWDEFAELNVSIKREIKSIELHFTVIELETAMTNALKEGGVKAEVIGKVDLKQIKVDVLQAVLDTKVEMETFNHSLPVTLKQKSKVVHLILDIRTAILQDKWDEVSRLLEISLDGQFGNLPEHSRNEIAVVRLEIENKQIIHTLNNALIIGRLEGEVGKANVLAVSCEHLVHNISFCKSLQPRTSMAVLLLHTAEVMYDMRRLICNPDPKNTSPHVIKWPVVAQKAQELIVEVQSNRVHSSVMLELKLVLATAEDTILCNAMTDALEHGGPTGEPGLLSIDGISVVTLDSACELAIRNTSVKTERVSQLFTACRTMKAIREALLRTSPPDTDRAEEAWKSIRELTESILEIRRKNAGDTSWSSCREELSLITKHAHIQQVRTSLIECIIKTSRIYAQRNTVNVSDVVSNTELLSSVEELDAIIGYAHQLEFENLFMSQFLDCAKTLKMMRVAIADENWSNLKELTGDRMLFASLKVLPEAVQEFAWVNCEFHNHMAFDIIKNALQSSKAESFNAAVVLIVPSPGSPAQSPSKQRSGSNADTLFDEHNRSLEVALKEVEKYKITSKSTLQLLDCCTNVLLLRKSLRNQDNVQVAKCLRWFKANVHLCPPHVQLEAQESYVKHQNDLLTKELTKALQRGKASGLRGDLNLSTIDTDILLKLIEQANDVIPKTAEVEDLLEAADIALTLRSALRDHNIAGLRDVIDVLHVRDSGFNLLIVDEIATARGEVDNEIVVKSLIEALKSFDTAEGKALDMSFLNQTPEERENELSDNFEVPETFEPAKPKVPGMSMLNSFSVRRYSFANKNNANIDPDTIDVEVLDGSIRIANDHGVYSIQARRLYRTVSLIRSLRSTMKASDWPKLQEIVSEAKFDEHIDDLYDSLACKEMQAIKSQLEMRAAVVDLSKALKIGWAKCSNGIVNTSQLCNDVLANAIDRADRSITELSMREGGGGVGLTDEVSPVQKQVQLLMTSAKLVLKIRDTLLNGNMEAAGALAHEGLSGSLHYSVVEELTLYTKEIDAALSTMSVFQALRAGMVKGSIKHLEKVIHKARGLHSQYSNDLGLVRTLEIAMRTYDALLMARQALIQCTEDQFSAEAIEKTIDLAQKLHLKSRTVAEAQDKLERLSTFESFVSDLTLSNFGVLTERESYEQLVDKADELNLARHPLSVRARVMLALTTPAFHTAALAEAFVHSSAYNVATETIQFKRMYLELSSSQHKYKLENFKNLRAPDEFAMRMNICCEDLKKNMLQHSDQSLPTSLTLQSPVVAALSVWVFIHCIRGIEKQMYTTPEVMLAKLVQLGRNYIPMRDEILLQCVKQIRNNKDTEAARRVWRILSCCLYHFPPSSEFEYYMELFLFIYAESSQYSSFSRHCIRFMHQSIFRYGYARKIRTRLDKSTDAMKAWLISSSAFYSPSHDTATSEAHPHNPSRFVDVFVDPAHDIAFRGYGALAAPATPATGSDKSGGPSAMAIKHHSIAGSGKKHESTASATSASPIPVPPAYCIRGCREDWINRFKQFNQDFGHKDGGHISRKDFALRLAHSTTLIGGGVNIDRVDKEVLYFLLFGKHIVNRKSIVRELHGDVALLHFLSDDERATSEARRTWLEERVTVAERASELFFSQLKSSDLALYAERFWDKIIDSMSRNCLHFPFFKWEGDEHGSGSKARGAAATTAASASSVKVEEQTDVMIGWELYREIILTGMKKYLDQEDSVEAKLQRNGGAVVGGGVGGVYSKRGGDISLKGYIMHSAEH